MSKTASPEHTASPETGSLVGETLAIAVGGALGASLRHAVALASLALDQHTAWATACANIVGAFALGFVARSVSATGAHRLLRPFLVVGFLGSFTTFSALALDNRLLAAQQSEGLALLHLTASVAAGLIAFAAGAMLNRGPR